MRYTTKLGDTVTTRFVQGVETITVEVKTLPEPAAIELEPVPSRLQAAFDYATRRKPK